MKGRWRLIRLALCLLITLTGTAGCIYEYPEPVRAPTSGSESVQTPTSGQTAGFPSPTGVCMMFVLFSSIRLNY
jgi:hypothetical protein